MYKCNNCLDGILVKVCCPELQPQPPIHTTCELCEQSFPFPLSDHHTFDECWTYLYFKQEDERRQQVVIVQVIEYVTVYVG